METHEARSGSISCWRREYATEKLKKGVVKIKVQNCYSEKLEE